MDRERDTTGERSNATTGSDAPTTATDAGSLRGSSVERRREARDR